MPAREKNLAYWREQRPAYPFAAQAPTMEPTPTDLILGGAPVGAFISVPSIVDHMTWWAFATETGRNAFLARYPKAAALTNSAIDDTIAYVEAVARAWAMPETTLR